MTNKIATPFFVIYNRFLSKITDDLYLELTKEDIPKGMIADFLLASAACYPAFRAKEIDGIQYIDGGYYDNMPINLAIKMGAEEVIAVDLNGIGFKRRVTDKQVPVTYIRSYWHLGNFLLFEKDFALRNIALGYNDAMKVFGQLEGFAYTFKKGETKKNAVILNTAFKDILFKTEQIAAGRTPAVLLKLITRLILGDLRKRRNLSETITVTEMFTASGEVCAEFFDIDPVPIYTMEQFNDLILKQYNETKQNAEETLFELLGTGFTVKEIIHLITKLDKSDIVWFIHQRFEAFLDGNAKEADLAVLCSAFTAETAAAFYLGLLLNITDI
ncbi:MAG: patatin-like phospholipase family protein [Oscillospiraceae bacterium]